MGPSLVAMTVSFPPGNRCCFGLPSCPLSTPMFIMVVRGSNFVPGAEPDLDSGNSREMKMILTPYGIRSMYL